MVFTLGEFLQLSAYLNHPCNLYKITKGLNQAKKDIPITVYTPSQLHKDIATYLGARIEQVANSGGNKADTVSGCVERLIKGMADADGSNCNLVKEMGKCIANVMIPDHELSLRDKLVAGFYRT